MPLLRPTWTRIPISRFKACSQRQSSSCNETCIALNQLRNRKRAKQICAGKWRPGTAEPQSRTCRTSITLSASCCNVRDRTRTQPMEIERDLQKPCPAATEVETTHSEETSAPCSLKSSQTPTKCPSCPMLLYRQRSGETQDIKTSSDDKTQDNIQSFPDQNRKSI